jgi:hypothetical protein
MQAILIPAIILIIIVAIFSGGGLVKDLNMGALFSFEGLIPKTAPKTSQGAQAPIVKQAPTPTSEPINVSMSIRNTSDVRITNHGNTEVDITGWKIVGRADTYTIPQGATFFTGDVNTTVRHDIILKKGQTAVISTKQNPLANNINFRTNACFGYLEKELKTDLPGSASCPGPSFKLEQIYVFSPTCQDFILQKVQGCTFPEYAQNVEILRDFDCTSYLKEIKKQFNYQSCLEIHAQDKNFIDTTWYIYTDNKQFLRDGHDRVQLFDLQNNLISQDIY